MRSERLVIELVLVPVPWRVRVWRNVVRAWRALTGPVPCPTCGAAMVGGLDTALIWCPYCDVGG